jgi:hypothetical protein
MVTITDISARQLTDREVAGIALVMEINVLEVTPIATTIEYSVGPFRNKSDATQSQTKLTDSFASSKVGRELSVEYGTFTIADPKAVVQFQASVTEAAEDDLLGMDGDTVMYVGVSAAGGLLFIVVLVMIFRRRKDPTLAVEAHRRMLMGAGGRERIKKRDSMNAAFDSTDMEGPNSPSSAGG